MSNSEDNVIQEQNALTLEQMRNHSDLTAREIVNLVGTTHQSLRNWEKGVSAPNVVIIEKLLSIYGYSYHQLDKSTFYSSSDEIEFNNKKQSL